MRLECAGVICLEPFKDFPQMGRFTLRDEGLFNCFICCRHKLEDYIKFSYFIMDYVLIIALNCEKNFNISAIVQIDFRQVLSGYNENFCRASVEHKLFC